MGVYIVFSAIIVSVNIAIGCMNIASAIRELADTPRKWEGR